MIKYYVSIYFKTGSAFELEFETYDQCLAYLMSKQTRLLKDVQLYQIECYETENPKIRNVVVLNHPVE